MMMNKVKKIIKKFIPKRYCKLVTEWRNLIFDGYSTKSYSQEGEDMILRRIFEKQEKGFYVDVGAHHPKRFSNTNYFYKRGWRGINIDAMPGGMRMFNKLRPRDINLEIAISDKKEIIKYYVFNDPALNSFSKDLVKKTLENGNYVVVDTVDMRPRRLSDILDEHLPPDYKIDFINVDVEGLDFEVLSSNNWEKYRPTMVLVEQLMTFLDELGKDKITQFMKEKGYSLYAKTVNSVFYLLL